MHLHRHLDGPPQQAVSPGSRGAAGMAHGASQAWLPAPVHDAYLLRHEGAAPAPDEHGHCKQRVGQQGTCERDKGCCVGRQEASTIQPGLPKAQRTPSAGSVRTISNTPHKGGPLCPRDLRQGRRDRGSLLACAVHCLWQPRRSTEPHCSAPRAGCRAKHIQALVLPLKSFDAVTPQTEPHSARLTRFLGQSKKRRQ